MIDEIQLNYSDFKAMADKKKFFWQFTDFSDKYYIFGYDIPTKYYTIIYKPTADIVDLDLAAEQVKQTDFETNYKADCNRSNTISPISGQSQFYGKTIELSATDTENYCEWSFDKVSYINKVMPIAINPQKGDKLSFEVWAKAGIYAADPIKVGQYAYDIPLFGVSGAMPWIYGAGAGEIPAVCTVRCYYHKIDGTERDFGVIAEFLI